MQTAPRVSSAPVFDFDYYRFNGKGKRPSRVPGAEYASFIRSRFSIPEQQVELATQRAKEWADQHGVSLSPKNPFPSNQAGKYWLEFHLGGLTL